ncbi:UNVERIFIED_CONTAM: hypothetical protein Sradi_2678000 [Sesamum radiatum]|uniref:Uncharacterized protein n=1 Tax=Sesamum radiatum TaxID=300843 RepID=A0AAW2S681_SESRA
MRGLKERLVGWRPKVGEIKLRPYGRRMREQIALRRPKEIDFCDKGTPLLDEVPLPNWTSSNPPTNKISMLRSLSIENRPTRYLRKPVSLAIEGLWLYNQVWPPHRMGLAFHLLHHYSRIFIIFCNFILVLPFFQYSYFNDLTESTHFCRFYFMAIE